MNDLENRSFVIKKTQIETEPSRGHLKEERHRQIIDSLISKGRCPKCTLRVPCKHYYSLDSISPSKNTIISLETPQNQQLGKTPEPKHTRLRENSAHLYFKFSDLKKRHSKSVNRYRTLEAIENYKERKMKLAIEALEDLKQQSREEKMKELKESKRKEIYNQKLKEKISNHYNEFKQKREELLLKAKERQREELRIERKRKRYFLIQKKKIHEYHQKKNLLDNIINSRISDLLINPNGEIQS